MGGTTFKRCSCRDPDTGALLGPICPRLRQANHGSWFYRLRAGRGRQLKKGGFATRADAERALDALRRELEQHDGDQPVDDTTVGQWLEFWLAE